MSIVIKYRGREVRTKDIEFIRELISSNPKDSRLALSKKLCLAWDWTQANGHLKDMVCRSLMLILHRAGHIRLPEPRCRPKNNIAIRKKPEKIKDTDFDCSAMEKHLKAYQPLEIRQVRQHPDEQLFNRLMETHHYLGYSQPVGEHLKYMVYEPNGRVLACMAWCSAVRHLGPRDRFIGWAPTKRAENIHFIAYNTRYLILPWVKVPHLASHLLGYMARHLPRDWQEHYGHTIHFLETFIDPELYSGTCYKAANWFSIGKTTGRGIRNKTQKKMVPVKEILVYPLGKNFREHLLK